MKLKTGFWPDLPTPQIFLSIYTLLNSNWEEHKFLT